MFANWFVCWFGGVMFANWFVSPLFGVMFAIGLV